MGFSLLIYVKQKRTQRKIVERATGGVRGELLDHYLRLGAHAYAYVHAATVASGEGSEAAARRDGASMRLAPLTGVSDAAEAGSGGRTRGAIYGKEISRNGHMSGPWAGVEYSLRAKPSEHAHWGCTGWRRRG